MVTYQEREERSRLWQIIYPIGWWTRLEALCETCVEGDLTAHKNRNWSCR